MKKQNGEPADVGGIWYEPAVSESMALQLACHGFPIASDRPNDPERNVVSGPYGSASGSAFQEARKAFFVFEKLVFSREAGAAAAPAGSRFARAAFGNAAMLLNGCRVRDRGRCVFPVVRGGLAALR